MLKYTLALLAFLSGAVAASAASTPTKWNMLAGMGEDYESADGSCRFFKVPDGYPYIEGQQCFNVSIDGHYVGLYNDLNVRLVEVDFAQIELRRGTEIEVVVSRKKNFENFEILPHRAKVSDVKTINKGALSFKVSEPNQSLSIVFDNRYTDSEVLHLMINDIDDEAPVIPDGDKLYDSKTKTYYFRPGYHDITELYGGKLSVAGERSIYLAPGAVVKGGFEMGTMTTGKIYGHGMAVVEDGTLMSVNWSNGGTIDGPLFHRHNHSGWQMTATHSDDIHMRNVKVIATRGGSTDGFDVVNVSNSDFENMFIVANDDAVVIKGLCDDRKPNENLRFDNLRLWSYCNCGFNLGAETHATYSDISLTNSEILWSYDDVNSHLSPEIGDRGALSICCLDATTFDNIKFENIIVNRCEKFISLAFNDSFWYGTLTGDQSLDGEIKNVEFKNVRALGDLGSPISNLMYLHGYTNPDHPEWTDKTIHDIYFENVYIMGEPVDSESHERFDINNTPGKTLVYNLTFKIDPTLSVGEVSAWRDDAAPRGIYSMQGIRLERVTAPGMYIIDGRKTAVR